MPPRCPPAAQGGEATPGLRLRSSAYGKVIFATNHRVLYQFGADPRHDEHLLRRVRDRLAPAAEQRHTKRRHRP
jgi:hypothetical protein